MPRSSACMRNPPAAAATTLSTSEFSLHAEGGKDRQPGNGALLAIAVVVDVKLLVLVVRDVLHVEVEGELPVRPGPGVLRAAVELAEERLAALAERPAGRDEPAGVGVER